MPSSRPRAGGAGYVPKGPGLRDVAAEVELKAQAQAIQATVKENLAQIRR